MSPPVLRGSACTCPGNSGKPGPHSEMAGVQIPCHVLPKTTWVPLAGDRCDPRATAECSGTGAPRPRFLLCGRGWTHPRRPLSSHCPFPDPQITWGFTVSTQRPGNPSPSSPPSGEPQRGWCPRSSRVSLSGSQGSAVPHVPQNCCWALGSLAGGALKRVPMVQVQACPPGWECCSNRAGDRRAPGCPGEPRAPQHSNFFKPTFSEHLNPQTRKGWRKGRGPRSWESLVPAGPGSLLGASAGLSLPCAPLAARGLPPGFSHMPHLSQRWGEWHAVDAGVSCPARWS